MKIYLTDNTLANYPVLFEIRTDHRIYVKDPNPELIAAFSSGCGKPITAIMPALTLTDSPCVVCVSGSYKLDCADNGNLFPFECIYSRAELFILRLLCLLGGVA